jgi:hypothetical protein
MGGFMGTFVTVWLIQVIALAILLAVLGAVTLGSPWGVFLDSRNSWSLNQFQIVMWTVVGLPLIFSVAIWRLLDAEPAKAWDFTIPGELLAAMGITLASSVTSVAIKSVKDNTRPAAVAKHLPGRASFADMFLVEEGDTGLFSIDATKVQNFLITVALLASYVWIVMAAFNDLAKDAVPSSLPAFSQQMIALLALSHGGYLVGKIPNRSGVPFRPDSVTNLTENVETLLTDAQRAAR